MIILKTSEQIEGIRQAGRILSRVFRELARAVEPGKSTSYYNSLIIEIIRDQGATPAFLGYRGFPGAYCASVNDTVIHGIPSPTVLLKEGDLFSCDIGVLHNGYIADSAWTFPVGRVEEHAEKLLKAGEESLRKAVSAVKLPGRVSDIGKAVSRFIKPLNYGIVEDFCGHGVGLSLHEEPSIPNYYEKGRQDYRFQNGMVLAIEPMINERSPHVKIRPDGWTVKTVDKGLSVHFEHTVAIEKGRASVLTDWNNFS